MTRRHALTLMFLLLRPASGAAEVLVRGGDGALFVVDDAGRGTSAGGALVGTPGVALSGSTLEVVVRGTDDALWSATRIEGSWSGFTRVGGTLTGAPAAAMRGGGLDVIARGADGACWHVRRTSAGWGEWRSLGGEFGDRATFGLASRDASSLDVFARGMDGAAWHSQLGPEGWTGFAPLGGALGSDPAACSWGPDRIDVVALAPDLSAQIRTWEPTGWSPWTSLGGAFAAGTALGIATPGSRRLIVAGIGTDERIWTNEMDASGWTGWRRLGDGRPTSSPSPVVAPSPPRVLGESLPRTEPPAAIAAPAIRAGELPPAVAGGLPTVMEARGLLDVAPSELIRLDRPTRPEAGVAPITITPEALRRLEHAPSEPFPGCDPSRPCVRVTLLGIRLDGDTGDPAGDGPGDEIAVRADAWYLPASGRLADAEPFMRETKVHGSRPPGAAGRVAQRVRAGTASADGGMTRGDRHPARLSTSDEARSPGELPLRLFEGPLDGAAQLRVVLSAWEVDGGEGPRACCSSWNLDTASSAWDSGMPGIATGTVSVTTPAAELELHDRPFGVFADLAGVMVLGGTLGEWRALAARSGLNGPGVLALEHADFAGTARCISFVHVTVIE